MRGEHRINYASTMTCRGSSPHARGTPSGNSAPIFTVGIIPACAGNTRCKPKPLKFQRDHPRMRGEHRPATVRPPAIEGSSPHARGTPRVNPHGAQTPGIIPACAGNTLCTVEAGASHGDHPRMRGEHVPSNRKPASRMGSSPHARGTQLRDQVSRSLTGIIPACAGNTPADSPSKSPKQDHPRMRGEHVVFPRLPRPLWGSSPHARGTRTPRHPPGRTIGIIPACAGNTMRRAAPAPRSRDHPRMRGEHVSHVDVPEAIAGSSPHARGTPCGRDRHPIPGGIIPACAGNTSWLRWS